MTPAERILGRALAASTLDSAQWSAIQAGIRDRAFFSARVDDARRLAVMRESAAAVAAGEMSPSDARLSIRRALEKTGYPVGDGSGDLRDLSSKRRLDLILQQNKREVAGYIRYMKGTTEGALLAFPAQELYRGQSRKAPRDWAQRWREAGGKIYGGGIMAARKDDPVWERISRFGHPWPPFDYGSGMAVRDIARRRAIELGIIQEDTPPPHIPESARPRFNEGLRESVPFGEQSPEMETLKGTFGDQISYSGGTVHWNSGIIRGLLEGTTNQNAVLGKGKYNPALLEKIEDPELRRRVSESGMTITAQWMQTHGQKHLNPSGEAGLNLPLTLNDFELIPSIWRNPDTVSQSKPGRLELALETLDGGTLFLGVDVGKGQAVTFRKNKAQ